MADGKALIAAALNETLDTRAWKPAGKAFLCKANDGTGTFIADSANRKIWLHRNDSSAPFTAYLPPNSFVNFADGDATYETMEVRLGYPDGTLTLTVRDAYTAAGQSSIGSQSPVEQTIAQAYWTPLNQITTLRIRPNNPVSMSFAVDGPFPYIDASGNLKILTSTALSATLTQPAAGKHQLGIGYFDRSANTVGSILNTAATATGTLPSRSEWVYTDVQAMATGWNPNYIPIGVFYLYNGQTALQEADFYRTWDLRPLFGQALTLPLSMQYGGTGSNLSAVDGFLRAVGGVTTPYKWKLNGTVAPGATDDANAGWLIGSIWFDTTNGKIYGCTANTVGAAVWPELTGANTALSNLASTAVNADILPSADNVRALGSSTLRYSNIWAVNTLNDVNAIPVKNVSGATANAGDVGYLDDNDEYKTTTTASDVRKWCVVLVGGANNADIYVTQTGRVNVNYTGTAPSTGDYLVTSTSGGLAQRQTTMHYAIFARCRAAGSGGVVAVSLLCHTHPVAMTNANYLYYVTNHSTSDFVATINGAPSATSVVYNAPSVGSDNVIVPGSGSLLKARLHNTTPTRNPYRLISSVNTGTKTITTVSSTDDWASGDTIKIESQTVTTGAAYKAIELDMAQSVQTVVPLLARTVDVAIYTLDTAAGYFSALHPFETYAGSKLAADYNQAVSVFGVNVFPLNIVSTVICWTSQANGSGTSSSYYQLQGWREAAP